MYYVQLFINVFIYFTSYVQVLECYTFCSFCLFVCLFVLQWTIAQLQVCTGYLAVSLYLKW